MRPMTAAIAVVFATGLGSACFLPEVDEAPAAEAAELCLACADLECGPETTACFDIMACGTLVDCFLACPETDSACAGTCVTDAGDGLDAAMLLLACTEERCPDDCPSL